MNSDEKVITKKYCKLYEKYCPISVHVAYYYINEYPLIRIYSYNSLIKKIILNNYRIKINHK